MFVKRIVVQQHTGQRGKRDIERLLLAVYRSTVVVLVVLIVEADGHLAALARQLGRG